MTESASADRRTAYLWIETAVVVFVCVVPLILTSELDVLGLIDRRRLIPFTNEFLTYTLRHISQSALVLFVIWRSGDPFSRFGLKPFKAGRDIFGGILIWLIVRIATRALWLSLRLILDPNRYFELAHSAGPLNYLPPSGAMQFAMLAVMCAASGFFQELLMRAYLIVRFEELFDSTRVAFLLSTLLFIFYHGYEGQAGVIMVSLFGVIEAVVFCIFRRLAPISIAHAVYNFMAIGNLGLF